MIPLRKGRAPPTPIQRGTQKWGDLYRRRSAVEREFGRLKHDYGLAFIRVRGIERVRLHADLVMLARLSLALSRVRALVTRCVTRVASKRASPRGRFAVTRDAER